MATLLIYEYIVSDPQTGVTANGKSGFARLLGIAIITVTNESKKAFTPYPKFNMADITKCTGEGCPIKDKCYRHTASNSQRQSWFVDTPGKWEWIREEFENGNIFDHREFQCDMYWGEQQDAVMEQVNNIFEGQ